MSEKVKHCGTCDNAKWFWTGCRRERRQYYCQLKLQRERQSSTGNERNAYIKYRDVACDEYINYNEG